MEQILEIFGQSNKDFISKIFIYKKYNKNVILSYNIININAEVKIQNRCTEQVPKRNLWGSCRKKYVKNYHNCFSQLNNQGNDRPWWPSSLSRHVSNPSKDRCLGPRFESPLGITLSEQVHYTIIYTQEPCFFHLWKPWFCWT